MDKRIRSLAINITDICNMECAFCLRGDRGTRKMDLSLIPRIFEGITQVDCITVTGGEPSCYVEAVTAIADYIVEHQKDLMVYGFFIVTNAKEYRQELVDAVKKVWMLLLEKCYFGDRIVGFKEVRTYSSILEEMHYEFGIAVSLDEYHEPIDTMNYFKYRLSGIYSDAKETDFSKGGVIARGRGEGLPNSHYRSYYDLTVEVDEESVDAEEVYVTVDGKVFADCDMSYDMEASNEPAGDLHEETLAEIMQRYADELMAEDE